MGKRAAWILSLAVLACTGILGIYNGVTDWRDASALFRQTITAGVFIYGMLGLAALIGFGIFWTSKATREVASG